ncbi:unnamed protein product [Nesidiocoris tenuis]|uniref:Uncharacterized protein n=1 Tax=Nesidiocoris tenuis TaxID=355587 RepID=A0A6H5HE34_9HEMI|nr:unnamed protein product [Nesidiocoris tenuis]
MLPSATGRSVSASPGWCNRLVVCFRSNVAEGVVRNTSRTFSAALSNKSSPSEVLYFTGAILKTGNELVGRTRLKSPRNFGIRLPSHILVGQAPNCLSNYTEAVKNNCYVSEWMYWNRPKIENRIGASEKTFSESLPEQVFVCPSVPVAGERLNPRTAGRKHSTIESSTACGSSRSRRGDRASDLPPRRQTGAQRAARLSAAQRGGSAESTHCGAISLLGGSDVPKRSALSQSDKRSSRLDTPADGSNRWPLKIQLSNLSGMQRPFSGGVR